MKRYSDGSLIDPQTPFQRFGAGMVGIVDGVPKAVAWATLPPWIDTIPGVEAWSLHVVLSMCTGLPSVTTDCLGNRRTLLEGREAATSATGVSICRAACAAAGLRWLREQFHLLLGLGVTAFLVG